MEKDIKEIGIMIRKKDLEVINYHKNGNIYKGNWNNNNKEGL